jgi:NADH:ubiquinone oxidoreductase subunit K
MTGIVIGALTALAPNLAQAAAQHEDAKLLSEHHFLQQRNLEAEHHELRLRAKAQHFKEAAKLQRQLYVTRMAHELDIARREGVRDVWKARNDTAQTMMIVESVFLAFVFELIVGGKIPTDLTESVVSAFAFFLGLAVFSAIVGIVLLMTQHHRLAKYDFQRPLQRYNCGRAHRNLNDYFDCHCAHVDRIGKVSFTISVTSAMVSCCIYGTAKWHSQFHGDVACGVLFTFPLALACSFVWAGPWVFQESTISDHEVHIGENEADALDGDSGEPADDATELSITSGSVGAAAPTQPFEGTTRLTSDAVSFAPTPLVSRSRRSSMVDQRKSSDYGGLGAEANEAEQFLAKSSTFVARHRRPAPMAASSSVFPGEAGAGSPLIINVELPPELHSEGESSPEVTPRAGAAGTAQPSPLTPWRRPAVVPRSPYAQPQQPPPTPSPLAAGRQSQRHVASEVGAGGDAEETEDELSGSPLFDRPTHLAATFRDASAGDAEVDAAALRDVRSFGQDDTDPALGGWSAFGDIADEMRVLSHQVGPRGGAVMATSTRPGAGGMADSGIGFTMHRRVDSAGTGATQSRSGTVNFGSTSTRFLNVPGSFAISRRRSPPRSPHISLSPRFTENQAPRPGVVAGGLSPDQGRSPDSGRSPSSGTGFHTPLSRSRSPTNEPFAGG